MGCTNKDHNINCQCHTGAPPEPIYVDDEDLVSYYNMLAGLPETEHLQQELNQTIIDCGGLEEACKKYPYVEMDLCRDGVFRPVNGKGFPRYSNIFHIMLAKRKYDLPDEGKKPLTKKMIEEHNARCAAIAQAESAKAAVSQPVQPQVSESNDDGFSFDLSSIVEGYDSIDANEAPTYQKTAMRETARMFKLSNLVEGYEDEPEQQYQEQEYGRPNVSFTESPIQETFYQPNAYYAPQADNYAPRLGNTENFEVSVDFGRLSNDAQTTVSSEDVTINSSGLLGEEDESYKLELKQEHVDEFRPVEEDYVHASMLIHPNDPRCYTTFQPAVDPRSMGAMMMGMGGTGIPYIGSPTPSYPMPSSLPFKPTDTYLASMNGPSPTVVLSDKPPVQKSPMRLAMEKAGLHPKTLGELNASAAQKGLPPVTKPGITMTSGGQECFSLDALRAQKKQQTPEQVQRAIECEQAKVEAREYWDRMRRPNWEPQNPILKTPEFPEGITKDHPEFNRVLTQIRADNQAFSEMETGMAHSMTDNAGEFDPGNPASYTKLQQDPTDEEVAKLFHDSQFGERQKAYNAAKTDEERQAAMDGKFTSPLKMNIPQGVYAPGLNGTKSAYLNGSTATSPSMFGGYYDDDAYLRATPEERQSGMYPEVTVVKMTEDQLRMEKEENSRYEPPVFTGKLPIEGFKIAVVKTHWSEDGKEEWDEFIAGDREVALEERHPAMDYKEATDYNSRLKAEDEVYTLARELGRYNKVAADTLLWYRNNVPLCDFIEVKREAQEQLMDYRNADNLSSAKSTVIIAGDKTIVSGPKPMSIEELEELANKEAKKLEKPSDIERTIGKYRNPVNKQLNAVFNNESLSMKIQRLQALSNIRVVSCADDKLMQLMDRRNEKLTPLDQAKKDNYLLHKDLKWRAATPEQRKTFDEDFDRWWNLPYGGVTNTKESAWKEYVKQRNLQNQIRYTNMMKNHKTQEQIWAENNAYIAYRQQQFDHGTIRDDMTANELFEAFGYLKTRMLEMEIERQKQDVRRLYDPAAYLAEVRKHSAIRNMQDGKGYVPTMDLMDKAAYNKKRQLFLNSIWETAQRGTIT